MSESRVSLIIQAIDRATAPLRRVAAGLARVGEQAKRVARTSGLVRVAEAAGQAGQALGRVRKEAGGLLLKFSAIAGVGGYVFKTQLLDVAAQFERFQTVLETTEGSSSKARAAMKWISQFAVETPYALEDVTEAYVKLRAYGLDPTNGLLKTLGDTAAAMDKPLMQAVEAIADAVTGENERLKEFGIKARTAGNRIVYEYTVNGETMRREAKANSREQIQATLAAIWNEKYGGAMEKLAKTWEGMLRNLGDQWSRFALMVMESGLFEWMKQRLRQVLDTIDQWAADGRLQRWAQETSKALLAGFKAVWQALPQVWKGVQQFGAGIAWLADRLGGWRNLAIALGVAMAGPLLAAVASLTAAVVQLGIALATTPIGWFLAAVAAIATAAYVIYDNWAGIVGYFQDLWARVQAAFDEGFLQGIVAALAAFNPVSVVADAISGLVKYLFGIDLKGIGAAWIDGLIAGISDMMPSLQGMVEKVTSWLPDWLVDWLKGNEPEPLRAARTEEPPRQAPRQPIYGPGAATSPAARVGGTVRIQVEGPARVREVRSDSRDVNLDVDSGLFMVGGS